MKTISCIDVESDLDKNKYLVGWKNFIFDYNIINIQNQTEKIYFWFLSIG